MGKMKAIECVGYGPPEVLRLTRMEIPEPKTHEILIRMRATAVTASDCIVRGFKIPRRDLRGILMGLVLGFRKPRKPVLGMIVSGTVEKTGSKAERFRPGDAVYGWTLTGGPAIRFGTYAEYVCLPQRSVIVPKPDTLTFEQAAAIPYGALIGLHFLKKGKIQQRKKVMIYGASGAIGTAAVQLAKYFGSEVTGVCSTGNLEMVKSLGADTVLDYTRDDPARPGTSYDLILDAVGRWKDSEFKQKCRDQLAAKGMYISVDDGSPKATLEDMELVTEVVKEGKLKAITDTPFALEAMVEAHRYVDQGHKKGNVVVTI